MKEKYLEPIMDIIEFETDDIIRTSDNLDDNELPIIRPNL